MFIFISMSRSIFHLYEDIPIAGERLKKNRHMLGSKGGIFIVPHLL
jgi:hypothetical protein